MAFYRDGAFKQVCPISRGASEFLGTSTETLLEQHLETFVETELNQMDTLKHQDGPIVGDKNSDIDVDLQDTGIFPAVLENTEEQHANPDSSMPDAPIEVDNKNEQTGTENIANKEDDMDVNSNEVAMDIKVDAENTGIDQKVDVDIKAEDNQPKKGKEKHSKKLIVLFDKYSEVKNCMKVITKLMNKIKRKKNRTLQMLWMRTVTLKVMDWYLKMLKGRGTRGLRNRQK